MSRRNVLNPRGENPPNLIEQAEKKEKLTRECAIAVEHMNELRERLADCVRRETVNQFVNCKELREQYFALCTDRYRGMVFPPGFEPTNREVPGLISPKGKNSLHLK